MTEVGGPLVTHLSSVPAYLTYRTNCIPSIVFYNTIGESYVSIALRAARAADPNAKLYINEYNTDGTGAKSLAMYNLVAKLKTQGVPIDGIGVQAHLISGSVPDTIQTNWAKFARYISCCASKDSQSIPTSVTKSAPKM